MMKDGMYSRKSESICAKEEQMKANAHSFYRPIKQSTQQHQYLVQQERRKEKENATGKD